MTTDKNCPNASLTRSLPHHHGLGTRIAPPITICNTLLLFCRWEWVDCALGDNQLGRMRCGVLVDMLENESRPPGGCAMHLMTLTMAVVSRAGVTKMAWQGKASWQIQEYNMRRCWHDNQPAIERQMRGCVRWQKWWTTAWWWFLEAKDTTTNQQLSRELQR